MIFMECHGSLSLPCRMKVFVRTLCGSHKVTAALLVWCVDLSWGWTMQDGSFMSLRYFIYINPQYRIRFCGQVDQWSVFSLGCRTSICQAGRMRLSFLSNLVDCCAIEDTVSSDCSIYFFSRLVESTDLVFRTFTWTFIPQGLCGVDSLFCATPHLGSIFKPSYVHIQVL